MPEQVETGKLLGRFPYVRAGEGERPLVIFPGVEDSMYDGRVPRSLGWAARWYLSRFVGDHSVYVISRPRGLPGDHSIGDMARDYAAVIADALGSADVLGISMGGMIAQDLAVHRPELVERLVLVNTGVRIADLETVDRFLGYAEARDWGSIRSELAAAMFSDWRAVAYPTFAATVGRVLQPRPAVASDVTVSLEAIRSFDSADRLGGVESPTLVFGGTDDPYFPEPILRETNASIPDAELELVRGAKHAAFHERKATFEDRTASFLER